MSSASVNEVRLIGNLGGDPEPHRTPSGALVVSVSLATAYHRRDAPPIVTWHRVVLWEGLAERAEQLMRKGASVYIAGRLNTRRYTDKDQIERWSTEVIAEHFQMLGPRPVDAPAHEPDADREQIPPAASAPEDDDIPF